MEGSGNGFQEDFQSKQRYSIGQPSSAQNVQLLHESDMMHNSPSTTTKSLAYLPIINSTKRNEIFKNSEHSGDFLSFAFKFLIGFVTGAALVGLVMLIVIKRSKISSFITKHQRSIRTATKEPAAMGVARIFRGGDTFRKF